MKDRSHDLRRVGRSGRDRRVLRGNRERLQQLWGEDGGAVHQPDHREAPKNALRSPHRWRIFRSGTDVIAVEPDGEHENVFTGGTDPYGDALAYAARELRKELTGEAATPART